MVIVGAGFAGMRAAEGLAGGDLDVLVVDQRDHHTFQPLLYQVATAGLHPQDVGYPLRAWTRRLRGVRFLRARLDGVDWDAREVVLEVPSVGGRRVGFDFLVLGAGAVTHDFGVPGVAEHGFGLKSLADARRIRDHILSLFDLAAARTATGARLDPGLLTLVVVGGGPTGVELAGALAELRRVLLRDHREIPPEAVRVLLVERLHRLLPGVSERSARYAARELRRRGVELRLGTAVTRVAADHIVVRAGDRPTAPTTGELIPTRTVLWAAGVRPHPIAEQLGVPLRRGRIAVDPDLRIVGHPEAFAVGDLAAATGPDGELLPQVAPVAIQQGRHVARQIRRLLAGRPTEPFRYQDRGVMATIGRDAAIAEVRLPGLLGLDRLRAAGSRAAGSIQGRLAGLLGSDRLGAPGSIQGQVAERLDADGLGGAGSLRLQGRPGEVPGSDQLGAPGSLRLQGRLAWAAWLALHLLYLSGVRNRLSVLLTWTWSYLTYDVGARLLLAEDDRWGEGPHGEGDDQREESDGEGDSQRGEEPIGEDDGRWREEAIGVDPAASRRGA